MLASLMTQVLRDRLGVEKVEDGWKLVEPESFNEAELIKTAVTAYQEIADSDPQKMGKSKACYSQLYQLTSIYKRLSR